LALVLVPLVFALLQSLLIFLYIAYCGLQSALLVPFLINIVTSLVVLSAPLWMVGARARRATD
jgi:hypothetical protein